MRELILDSLFWGSISHLPLDTPAEAIFWRIEKSFRLIEPRRLFHNLCIFARRYPEEATLVPFCFVQELLFFSNTVEVLIDRSYIRLCAALFGANVDDTDLEIKGDNLFPWCYCFISNLLRLSEKEIQDIVIVNPHMRWFIENTFEKSSVSDSWDLDTCEINHSNWRYMYRRWKDLSKRCPKYVIHVLRKSRICESLIHIFFNFYNMLLRSYDAKTKILALK